MAISSNVQTLFNTKKVKENEFAVKGNVVLNDDTQAEKILSVSCKLAIKNVESRANEVGFEGNLYADVLYISKNGETEHTNAIIAFSSKFDCEEKTPFVKGEIVDAKAKIESDGANIVVESALKVELFNSFVENLLKVEPEQNVYVKTENKNIKTISAQKSELFTILDEASFADNSMQVLCVNNVVLVKDVTINSDIIAVNFDVVKDITYTYGEDRLVKVERKSQSFKQEFANTFKDATEIVATVDLKSEKYSFEADGEHGMKASFVCIMQATFNAICEQTLELVQDAFCETNELLISKQCFIVDEFVEHFDFSDKISLNVKPIVDVQEVVALCGVSTNIATKEVVGDTLNIEGIVCADVLFKDFSANKIKQTPVSAPFSVSVPYSKKATDIEVVPQMRIIGQKSKKDNGIDLIFDGYFDVLLKNNENICFVSNIELSDEKQKDTAPISIYVLDDEDNFGIAKGLNVPPEQIDALMQTNANKKHITLFRETK